MNWFRLILATATMVQVNLSTASSGPLHVLSGKPVLTISGLDQTIFPDGVMKLDMTTLQSIGRTEINTTSIWTEGQHRYTGVLLKSLVTLMQIKSTTLRLHALNDYEIDFPSDDATDTSPILAYELDGTMMSIRDKGPIWVIYPYDDGDQYRTDTNYSRSIWQLNWIEVLP